MVGTVLPGYVNETSSILSSALPRDLTPSRNDGGGNLKVNLDALNSKYDEACEARRVACGGVWRRVARAH
jgi:hypothetical protein